VQRNRGTGEFAIYTGQEARVTAVGNGVLGVKKEAEQLIEEGPRKGLENHLHAWEGH